MSYSDFAAQISGRGAIGVTRSRETKMTLFEYQGQPWRCTDKNQAEMTRELSDGYEMDYCLAQYCERITE